MSILTSTYLSDSKTMRSQKSSQRHRNNSGELDVFEATRYFSGFADMVVVGANPSNQAVTVLNPSGPTASELDKEDRQHKPRGERRSLDVPMTRANVTSNGAIAMADQNYAVKEKSPRTPSSPGGKIVNFLNSLFNQSTSTEGAKKKKVKKKTVTRSLKDQDQISPGGWQRRRRNSIGHTTASSKLAESKSLPSTNHATPSFFDTNSDSRMPPSCTIVNRPRNDARSLPYHRQAAISVSIGNRAREEFAKWKVSCVEKEAKNPRAVVDPCGEDKDDGNESDTSSDLFELPVCDSTRMDSIRRSSMSTDSSGSSFMKLHVEG